MRASLGRRISSTVPRAGRASKSTRAHLVAGRGARQEHGAALAVALDVGDPRAAVRERGYEQIERLGHWQAKIA